MSVAWQAVVAALADPVMRAALAEIDRSPALTARELARAQKRWERLGVVRCDADAWVVDELALREVIAAGRPARSGVERFLDGSGRIDRYPAQADERRELLRWIVVRAVGPDDVLTEAEMTDRLEPFTTDVAVLRRYLVDHGLLERTRSGSQYARPADDLADEDDADRSG